MQTMSIEAVCGRYGVDMAHARHVAKAALRLFDETREAHQLEARQRELAEAGAMLHDVALTMDETVDEPNHHTAGRDIVVGAPLKGYSHAERLILACIVAFQRGPVQPSREPSHELFAREPLFKLLSEPHQHQTLILSALVSVANGLDASQTHTTEIVKVEHEASRSTLHVRTQGPYSHEDAAHAEEKADLWLSLFGPMRITGQIVAPGITLDDTLATAGRRIMRYRFDSACSGKPKVWQLAFDGQPDDAAKAVRKLRVATRRLRADLRIFEPCYKRKVIRPIVKGLRSFANALGPTREYDMLLANLDSYIERCDEEARSGIAPLREYWCCERQQAYESLLQYARSDNYRDWLDRFIEFMTATDSAGFARDPDLGEPSHVRHVVRAILWHKIAAVRAFDVLPDQPTAEEIHALRIAIKQLRYTADAFREVLPEDEVKPILAQCVVAQDEYGAINDAHTAAVRAREFASHARLHRHPQPRHRAGSDVGARTYRQREKPPVTTSRVATRGIFTYATAQEEVIASRLAGWRAFLQPFLSAQR